MNKIVKTKIEIIAQIDAKDEYFEITKTTPQTTNAKIDIVGLIANTTPKVVAIPLPPLKPRNKDQSCPHITANPAIANINELSILKYFTK